MSSNPSDQELDRIFPARRGVCRAYLMIASDDLTPDELSQRVGLSPSDAAVKGQPGKATGKAAPSNMWMIDSALEAGPDYEAHVENVLSRVGNVAEDIHQLTASGEAVVRLVVVRHYPAEIALGFALGATALSELAALGASLDVDDYQDVD